MAALMEDRGAADSTPRNGVGESLPKKALAWVSGTSRRASGLGG